jgi:hypothetical protein
MTVGSIGKIRWLLWLERQTHHKIKTKKANLHYMVVCIISKSQKVGTIQELKIVYVVGNEIPFEKDMSNWYPV